MATWASPTYTTSVCATSFPGLPAAPTLLATNYCASSMPKPPLPPGDVDAMMTRLYTREGSVGDLSTVGALSLIAEVARFAWDPVALERLIHAIDDACGRRSLGRPALRKALRDCRKREAAHS